MDVDIVIVGGGAAGIGAARALSGRPLRVLMVEASSRLGGRGHTTGIAGHHLDLGCGWLHSARRNAWAAIAEESGVPVTSKAAAWGEQVRDLGFTPEEQDAAGAAFGAWQARMERRPPASDRASDALPPDATWHGYIRALAGFISGAPLERLSVRDWLTYDEHSTSDNWRVPSGYGALVAASLPLDVPVRLATPVRSIDLGADGVRLDTDRGPIRARAAIVTVSTAVLASGAMALPADLAPWREAAGQLPLGRNEKLFLEILGSSPFEPETHVLARPRQADSGSHYIRPFSLPVIECFLGGDGARLLEEEGPSAGFDRAVGELVALFGSGVRRHLRPLVASAWGRTAAIGGGYSYALPGCAGARGRLARPFDDRLFFAGEAIHPSDFSTAHGAHDSGARAAGEALGALAGRTAGRG